jgi:hypothetical protein
MVGERSNLGINYSEKLSESVDSLIEYTKMVAEKTDQSITYTEKLAESTDFLIEYTKMVAETTDNTIEYTEKLAESTDFLIEYTKHVAEKADQGIEYTKVVSESLNNAINHMDYIVEETTNRWNYQTHINEQLDNVISHNDYIVEGHDSIIQYSEHLREQTENLSNYVNFVVESLNENNNTPNTIVESVNNIVTESISDKVNTIKSKETPITESLVVDTDDTFKMNITNQLNAILESAKTEKVNETKSEYHFLTFLDSSKRNEFESLNEETQSKVVYAFNNNKFFGANDALRIWDSCFESAPVKKDWLNNMPEKYKGAWTSLNESQKNAIKAQASTRVLNTQYQIDNFWDTRDLREVPITVNESTSTINESSTYQTPDAYMDAVRAGFRNRFKR